MADDDWDFLASLAENELDALFPTQIPSQIPSEIPQPQIPQQIPLLHPHQPTECIHDYVEFPGPAGVAIRAAERRRTLVEHDDCFEQIPWLLAMEFAYPDGEDSNIGAIPGCLKKGKLGKIVGVIKECSLNPLGDLSVLLKDTTGSIPATIHHKLLDEVKGICIGCVLVVQNASVFIGRHSDSPMGVNITRRNLVKVYYRDGREVTPTFYFPPNLFVSEDGASTSRTR